MARFGRVTWVGGLVLIGSAWAYSYADPRSGAARLHAPGVRVSISRGQCEVFAWRPHGPWLAYHLSPIGRRTPSLAEECRWHVGQFGADVGTRSGGSKARAVVPFWFIAAVWTVPAIVIARRPAGRHSTDPCGRCGYDLRATPGRCPECGTVPA